MAISSSGSPPSELGLLLTEQRHPASERLDELPTLELMQVIHAADREVADAVGRELPQIARAVDGIVDRMHRGGRLFYLGAGTSGRLGVLDASECPPTFNVSGELVQGVIAGGERALRHAVEGAEDDPEQARRDLQARAFNGRDALVAIAASGRTPYVLGALAWARAQGALTIGLSCVPGSEVARAAEIAITPAVGPEVVTGSTRMRAGTATKMVLNMLSTGAMVRRGLVFGNLMIHVQPTNAKLRDRAERIVAELTGLSREAAAELLAESGAIKTAVAMARLKVDRAEAERRLLAAGGDLRRALRAGGSSEGAG